MGPLGKQPSKQKKGNTPPLPGVKKKRAVPKKSIPYSKKS